MSDSILSFTSLSGTCIASDGAAIAVPSCSRRAASARTRLATSTCCCVSRTERGGGSRMNVGVRQPSRTASARKCASMPSARGLSSRMSAAVSSRTMKASKTCADEMIRRTCSDEIRTAAISRSRSERSSESTIARRTSWSWCLGLCSSSSCRTTSITSAESKYSRTRSMTLALNSSSDAGGRVCRRLDAVNTVFSTLAFTTSGGSGSGPSPFHSTIYFVPAGWSSRVADADGRSSSRPFVAPRNWARGTACALVAMSAFDLGG
mmetsp:Transcript_5875/g.18447  ORF Transcript_5875/g.18447 Transcript_5875/m.18447 type:complete len:264 (-) Transcript_5875:40-831(-)